MSIFGSLARRFRGPLCFSILASLASAGAGIALINEINRMIAAPVLPDATRIFMMAVMLVVLFVFGFLSQSLLAALGHRVVHEMRLIMVKRVLDTGIERLESIGAPALYATLTKDIPAIGMAFNRVPMVVYNALLLAGGFAYLAWLSWQLFLLAAAVLIAGAALAQAMLGRMRGLMKQVRENDDKLYAGYQGAIDGRYELALNAWRRRAFFQRDVEPAVNFSRVAETRADRYWMLSLNWTATLIVGLVASIFLAGIRFGVPRETVVSFALVLMFLRTPLSEVIGTLPMLLAGSVALNKIHTLELAVHREGFDLRSAEDALDDIAPSSRGTPLLQLEAVEYAYAGVDDERGFQLGPVDLSIQSGELLFIVGGNGSGKSTLARLLTGLYQPTRGVVKLGGTVVEIGRIEWYRNHFSTVFSDFHLFERLVGPRDEVDQSAAKSFLERLQMSAKVSVEEGRLSTRLLSQGQRKRLALLIAHAEKRPILLLDEWAADQDPGFRAFFYESLLPELRAAGKTIIAISHDDRYFHLADRVLKCESGRIGPLSAAPARAATSDAAAGPTACQARETSF